MKMKSQTIVGRQKLYNYNVEFVLEHMVIITNVSFDEPDLSDEFIIEEARQHLIGYYKIDPEVLHLQDVNVFEVQYVDEQSKMLYV